MTRNNTLNKVHIAATELPQLLSQKTNMFGEATAQSRCQTLCSSKLTEKKIKLLEVEGARSHRPIVGDACSETTTLR